MQNIRVKPKFTYENNELDQPLPSGLFSKDSTSDL